MYNDYLNNQTQKDGGDGGKKVVVMRPVIGGRDTAVVALTELHERLGTRPGEEHKWMSHPAFHTRLGLKNIFRPAMPRSWSVNDREWLSNLDIEEVMRQYERTIPDFAFIGVFPMDFASRFEDGQCVSEVMCNFRVEDLWKAGKRQVGVVFNMDTHDKDGSHWVSCHVGLDPRRTNKNYGVLYYDSMGYQPTPEVQRLMLDVRDQVHALHGKGGHDEDENAYTYDADGEGRRRRSRTRRPFMVDYNKIRKQFKNTECGVFSMFFLVCCASGRLPFSRICASMGHDDDIHTLRRTFFTPTY